MNMKRLVAWLLCAALLTTMIPVSFVAAADETKDVMDNFVVGTIFEEKALTALPGGIGYGNGWAMGLGITAGSVEPKNLALSMRLYIQNDDTPGDLSILQAASRQLKVLTQFDTGKEIIWLMDEIKTAQGTELKAGEWNDVLLPLSTGNGYGKFDFATDVLDCFWLEFAQMTNVAAHTIKMEDVAIVDTSRAKASGSPEPDAPVVPDETVMDNYVISTIYEKKALSPIAGGYGNGWTNSISIRTAGVAAENLALSMKLYIKNEDDPADLSILSASSNDLKLATEISGGKNLIWKMNKIKTAQGGAIKAGEWNDILLPFSTGSGYNQFDFEKDVFTFFWLEFGGMSNVGSYTVRMMDVAVVDTSRAKQKDEAVEFDTTYDVAEIPFTWTTTIRGTGTSTGDVGHSQTFKAIDASRHDPKKLRLLMDIQVENLTNPGDVSVLTQMKGQLELTSSGGCDIEELATPAQSLDWRDGKNEYSISIASGETTGGALDYSKINYLRLYMNEWPATFTDTIKITVSNVRLVDVTNAASMPTLFSDGMVFQQNKDMNLWGYMQAAEVTAKLYKGEELLETKTAATMESGRWELAFSPRAGSYDTYTVEVLEGDKVIKTIRDVLVGEVWIAAGQSNMELQVSTDMDAADILNEADDAHLRIFLEPTYPMGNTGEQPLDPAADIPGAVWGYGNNRAHVSRTSSIGYQFAKRLREALDVPVALVNAAIGGTVIEGWLPRDAVENDDAVKKALLSRGLYYDEFFWSTSAGTMSTLYNQKIGPLEDMNIAGVIWYQGESNSNRSEIYDIELDLLKRSWSEAFGYPDGDMPFIFTQVAPYRYDNGTTNAQHLGYLATYMERGWALSKDKNTAMLTVYDLPLEHMRDGSSSDPIHPRVKTPVAERFFESAMNMVYGGGAEYTAPVYKSMEIRDNAIYITFDRVGDCLVTTDDSWNVHGFTIAGEDGVYVAAEAQIVDDNVVKVWNNRVANPKNVIYAFDNFNQGANLCNSSAIPASPFRTVEADDTTMKPSASITYFTAQDWMTADKDVWVYNSKNTEQWNTGYQPSFTASEGASYQYSRWIVAEGLASVQLDYTKSASLSPVLTYESLKLDYSKFTSLSVKVLNPDVREKTLTLQVKVGSKLYTVAAENGDLSVQVPANQTAFSLVTFDLTKLFDADGAQKDNYKYLLRSLEGMTFTVEDTEAGVVFFDAFSVGTTAPVVANEQLNEVELPVLLTKEDVDDLLNILDDETMALLPEGWLTAYRAARADLETAAADSSKTPYELTLAAIPMTEALEKIMLHISDEEIMERCDTLAGLLTQEIDPSLYTPESVQAYREALAAAEATLNNLDATAKDLQAAIDVLQNTLVERKALFGDANGDGKVSTADAALALQYAAELIGDDAIDTTAADVNGDGKVTTADAALILQYAAELIDTFPREK